MKAATILLIALLAVELTGCGAWEARRAALNAPSADVAGTWTGKTTGDGNFYPITLTLDQTGTDITGSIRITGRPDLSGRVQGTVQGEVLKLSLIAGSPFRWRNVGPAGQPDDQQRIRSSFHAASLEVGGR